MSKKRLLIIASIVVGVVLLTPPLVVFLFVWSEGYPRPQAMRNWLIKQGEIRIEFPPGSVPDTVVCDDVMSDIVIEDDEVIVYVGYTWINVTVELEDGTKWNFEAQKLNDWNRILYVPKNADDLNEGFRMFENGVEKEPMVKMTRPEP